MVLKYDRANLLTKPTSTANTPKRCQSRCRTCPPSSCKLPPYIYQRLNKGGASKHLTGNNPQQTLPGPSRPLARPDAHPEAHLRLKQRRLRVRAGRRHLQDVQERERGRGDGLRPRLHGRQRHLEPGLAVRAEPVVLLQGVRQVVSPGPGARVSTSLVPDVSRLKMRGIKNGGKVLQDCGLDDMIFTVPQLVSFLSRGTTLPAGTVIITGTPAGIGAGRTPKEWF